MKRTTVLTTFLLVVEAQSSLWAIDTASTNGVALEGEGVRVHRLHRGLVELQSLHGTSPWRARRTRARMRWVSIALVGASTPSAVPRAAT